MTGQSARDELEALAVRVEAASGPDRELDAAIAHSLGWGCVIADPVVNGAMMCWRERYRQGPWMPLPAYTASLDAAMTLVPDFPHLVLVRELWNGPGTENGKSVMATIQRYGKSMWTGDFTGLTNTFPLALTAACLRARAAHV